MTEQTDYEASILRNAGMADSHELHWHLVSLMVKRPTDFEPWGQRPDSERGSDCSCGCRWFFPLEVVGGDWGVCGNAKSPRLGLLTFEHQGCPEFEQGLDDE